MSATVLLGYTVWIVTALVSFAAGWLARRPHLAGFRELMEESVAGATDFRDLRRLESFLHHPDLDDKTKHRLMSLYFRRFKELKPDYQPGDIG